jgi:hypothetical protein
LFAAAWTLGSLKYLAESGVASVTYFEMTGWRGETEAGSPLPELFASVPGNVFPLWPVFADLAECVQAKVVPTVSSLSSPRDHSFRRIAITTDSC